MRPYRRYADHGGNAAFARVYIDDLVDAVSRVLRESGARGEVFNVIGEQSALKEFVAGFGRSLDAPAPRRVPEWAVQAGPGRRADWRRHVRLGADRALFHPIVAYRQDVGVPVYPAHQAEELAVEGVRVDDRRGVRIGATAGAPDHWRRRRRLTWHQPASRHSRLCRFSRIMGIKPRCFFSSNFAIYISERYWVFWRKGQGSEN